MPPDPAKNLLDRFLDVVFGKKLEGYDADRARAEWAPQWARTGYFVLSGASIFLAFAILAWSWGWLPFMDSRVDSIWAAAALGVNMLLREAWQWLTRRHERRAKSRAPSQAAFSE